MTESATTTSSDSNTPTSSTPSPANSTSANSTSAGSTSAGSASAGSASANSAFTGTASAGSIETDRAELRELIQRLAVVRGKVTLSSGLEADYYVDLRRITLHGQAAPMVGRVMLDLVSDWRFDAIGGLTMGADPVATAMLHASASAATAVPPGEHARALDAFVVRKAAKGHGLQRQIEGPDIAGRRVLILEDTSTTGGSPRTALEAARAAGAEVVGVAVIVDRDTGAREKIEALGVPYRWAYDLGDLGITD